MFGFNDNQIKTISPKNAYERLKSEKDIVLLDVRTMEEYKEKRIPNSINIPLNLLAQVEKKIPDKEQTIFVYCLSGNRSNTASKILNKFGYKHVYNMGGISNWFFETVRG
ncbi:MAG: sulfurtransferase [Clostridiales bacterium GWB2_37_7]|nr:MAG: sulfurtransferase [Clostridiales bacterium GWB2_37_7]